MTALFVMVSFVVMTAVMVTILLVVMYGLMMTAPSPAMLCCFVLHKSLHPL